MAQLARRLSSSNEWQDVLQESVGAAWRKRSQFDPTRGTARNWLLAIVADQAGKSRRRVNRRRDGSLDGAAGAAAVAVASDLDLNLERALPGSPRASAAPSHCTTTSACRLRTSRRSCPALPGR
jgi:RNA polymerase sigma-70 factor (ECF subfamily)